MLWCFLIPCGSIKNGLEAKLLTKRKVNTKIMTQIKLHHLGKLQKEKKFFFLSMHTIHNMMHMDTKAE